MNELDCSHSAADTCLTLMLLPSLQDWRASYALERQTLRTAAAISTRTPRRCNSAAVQPRCARCSSMKTRVCEKRSQSS